MNGPFALTSQNISLIKREPGVYILGGEKSDGSYWGCYVGRSDDDVHGRISNWFNLIKGDQTPRNESEECVTQKNPTHYWREYTTSAEQAYNLECKIYHERKYTCNDIHPASNGNWSCPVCGQ